jgi:hypothetical protein
MSIQDSNRRKNIRFRTRVPEVIQLLFNMKNFENLPINAIKIDENIKCISCIMVSPFDLNEGMVLTYIEHDGFKSIAKINRAQLIEDTVYKIVFEITDETS